MKNRAVGQRGNGQSGKRATPQRDFSSQALPDLSGGMFVERRPAPGASWAFAAPELKPIPGTACRSLELTDLPAMAGIFSEFRPDAVIHLAAMSGLGACQRDPASSYKINVDVSRRIAELCAEAHIPCVFSSTDIVFDGCCAPYSETDPVAPVNVYGEHKALAEAAMLSAFPEVSVCRLSLVFGMDGGWIRPDGKAMLDGAFLKLFADEYRTPIRAGRVVEGLLLALEKSPGILHLGGGERVSRYDFGHMIAEMYAPKKPHIVSCGQKDVDLGTPRPSDVSLSIDKARALGFQTRSLLEELSLLKSEILMSKSETISKQQ